MGDFELVVIDLQRLARAVEIDRPVFIFDFLIAVGQGDQHLVAGRPVGTQLGTVHAVLSGTVVQHLQIDLQLAELINHLLVGHGRTYAAQ
ncbi:hypothetical protein D3C75_1142730 [compost metagenome]